VLSGLCWSEASLGPVGTLVRPAKELFLDGGGLRILEPTELAYLSCTVGRESDERLRLSGGLSPRDGTSKGLLPARKLIESLCAGEYETGVWACGLCDELANLTWIGFWEVKVGSHDSVLACLRYQTLAIRPHDTIGRVCGFESLYRAAVCCLGNKVRVL
jgi:hypothetical protein